MAAVPANLPPTAPAPRAIPWLGRISITAKLVLVVAGFAAIIMALSALLALGVTVNHGVRAYLVGEGLWSKGQKDAVYYLTRYARTGDELDYRKYLDAIAIPMADRQARLELEKPQYDYAVVERGFVGGGNAAEDVPAMIFMFRYFGRVGHFKRAIGVWREADLEIDRLVRAAAQLHEAVAVSAPETEVVLREIELINTELTRLERAFSATLIEGAHWSGRVVFRVLLIITAALLAFGLALAWTVAREFRRGILNLRNGARRVAQGDFEQPIEVRTRDELGDLAAAFNDMIAQRRATEAALKASTELARSVVATAYDAFIAMDAEGLVTDWNQQAERVFGWSHEEALGRTLAELIIPPQHRAHQNGLKRFLETGEGPVLNRRIEITALNKDGREFPVELTIWAMRSGGTYRFNAFLHDISEQQQAARRLVAQKAAATALVESPTLADAGVAVLKAICEALDWDVGAIWLRDPEQPVLRCAQLWHRAAAPVPAFEAISREQSFAAGVGLPGRVWSSGQPVWIPDVSRDDNFPRAKYAEQDGMHTAFGIPIRKGGEVLGVMEFFSHAMQAPDEALLRMLDTLGNLLGQFVGRQRAEEQLERDQGFLKAVLENLSDGVVACDEHGALTLFNRATREFHGLPEEPLPPEQWAEHYDLYSADGRTRLPTEQVPLYRAFRGEKFADVEIVIAPKGLPARSMLCYGQPLTAASGAKLGAVVTMNDITERKRSDAAVKRLSRVHAVLSGINSLIVRVRNREDLLREVCRTAVEQGDLKSAWIGLSDTDGELLPSAMRTRDADPAEQARLVPDTSGLLTDSPAARALRDGRICLVNDVALDPTGAPWRAAALEQDCRAVLACPLTAGGKPAGVICFYAAEAGFFDTEETRLLTEVADNVSYALEFIAREAKIDYLAYYDPLTELPNRRLFMDRLEQSLKAARQARHRLAVLILDLEHFKSVNDTVGLAGGDELLKQVVVRLLASFGPAAGLARVGGDVFAIVVPYLKDAAELPAILQQRVWNCFEPPFALHGHELRIGARLGIAIHPEDGEEAESLFHNAEAALNRAKDTGDRYMLYTQQMTTALKERLSLESGLRRALEHHEYVLHYQPRVDLRNGAICGAEALIRWHAPGLGLVPPAKFIPALEETGLMLEVGRWVLQQATADYRRWQAQGLSVPRVAVNVSQVQLRQPDFVDTVRAVVAAHSELPRIDLEVTESMLMRDIEQTIEKLKQLRELGLELAIDDFGTGYSSLAYLAKLPVNAIKIDRSFIASMGDSENTMNVVSTIISLAHSMNLRVIAEGVDSQEQLKFLRLLRCDEMQGYLFSKPLPADEFAALLRSAKLLPLA